MQFCKQHWSALRAAIDAEGVSHLIAKDGAAAARAMRREIEGTTGADFDPLMSAHNMIVGRAMDGLGAIAIISGGCPLCACDEAHKRDCPDPDCKTDDLAGEWIAGASHAAAEHARRIRAALGGRKGRAALALAQAADSPTTEPEAEGRDA